MPEPPSVCLVTLEYWPTVGGVAVAVRRLVRSLVADGYDVHVVVPFFSGGPPAPTRDHEDGATIHRISMNLAAGLQQASLEFLGFVRELDREVRFALFHSFFLVKAYACTLLAGKRPVIISVRGGDMVTQQHPAIRSTAVFSLQKARWVTSVNQIQLDDLQQLVDLTGRSSVLRNGIAPVPASSRWTLATCERGTVGTVGQFRRVKDIPLLVRAYAAVAPALRRKLLLVGSFTEAAEERWSQTLMHELGVEEQVEVTGDLPRDRVFEALARLHVYVQNSAFEGLPNALLEAASCGVPLVATAVGGMKEVLRDGDNALVVPHGNPPALARAIERILADDALASRLSAGSLALADELSIEREQSAWLELYARMLVAR
ncbi:MAG: glycosyltransferase family 4 protein [Acidobacteriota bacterium]